MKITYYGHACFGIEVNNKHLLFDPFITPNELAKEIDVEKIKADYIFISHGHEDHIADAISIAKRTGAKIISNYEIVVWFSKQGIDNGHPMNFGGSWDFDFGKVKFVHAIHSSSMPDGSYGGNPGGFIIETSEGNFYHAGDTALSIDMKLIGKRHTIDFALLPVGNNFTMDVKDALKAAKYIDCNKIIAMHYDTFPYIVVDDKEGAKAIFVNKKRELIFLTIGKTTVFNKGGFDN